MTRRYDDFGTSKFLEFVSTALTKDDLNSVFLTDTLDFEIEDDLISQCPTIIHTFVDIFLQTSGYILAPKGIVVQFSFR